MLAIIYAAYRFSRESMNGVSSRLKKGSHMRHKNRPLRDAITGSFLLFFIGIGTTVQAQGRMTIQATAMGTSTQLGKVYSVNILIEQFSTPDDRIALIDAFKRWPGRPCGCP